MVLNTLRPILYVAYTIFINGSLAILKNLRRLQLRKELNDKKDRVKMSHYV